MTAVTQTWRALELRVWVAFYDTALVRLLIAAGKREAARAHVRLSLQMADETDIHFYDAESVAAASADIRRSGRTKADLLTAITLARRQGAGLFELRSAVDYFEGSRGRSADGADQITNRLRDTTTWPELAHARAPARVNRTKPRVAILGGGMAGLAAAWRLTEPGWRDRLESVTVYQRGSRLGGKGASSRGDNGRIEEHGLHVWLGLL